MKIPPDHPRAEVLKIRERLVQGFEDGYVVPQGMIAQGRGEAFDYLIGEKTIPPVREAIKAAAAAFKLAEHPVISVNGNTAALCSEDLVELSEVTGAPLEVNLFHRTEDRVKKIAKVLKEAGADRVLGVDPEHLVRLPNLSSPRAVVDDRGIHRADVVLVPLEDGDRTNALKELGKTVVAIDLNPLSRTARSADITIVDNVVRCVRKIAREYERMDQDRARYVLREYDNGRVLARVLDHIRERLRVLADEAAGAT
ncbi:4-phosphopantoate--beta-alanine ligase [Methanopyrus sp. SNP6]|uniref:4-phosphopantoate--beta-alanine ligase n=1 Tax=Methanopyrus sp. SNP6 TaxID=1937005 RepID=UPI0011E5BCB5|nr:4-phosphopantoate--beta-alanine ligase [Methanopyrus sp. SNP6]